MLVTNGGGKATAAHPAAKPNRIRFGSFEAKPTIDN
jgi:hypothetical protein